MNQPAEPREPPGVSGMVFMRGSLVVVGRTASLALALLWAAVTLLLSAVFGVDNAFAEANAYHIRYRYQLTNKTDRELRNVRVHIPIPRTCPYQEIQAFEITPTKASYRMRTVLDRFGQEICRIVLPRIGPRESAEVGFACDVVLHPDHRIRLDRDRVGTLADIPKGVRARYASNLKYVYDLESAEIRETSARLVKPHRNLLDQVMAIHDFVAGMTYKRDGRWDPASAVLRRMSGSCSEFSYLFCALCRAARIPTRFAGGSSCRRKRGASWPVTDQVYHRWAEVYLPPYGWVPFDVTRDRGDPPKRTYVGAGPRNVLILTRGAGGSRYLANQYIGSNSQLIHLERKRTFIWSAR